MAKRLGSATLIIILSLLFLCINLGGQKAQAEIDERLRWSPRAGHSTVGLPNGSIILMGGFVPGEEQFGDVWIIER